MGQVDILEFLEEQFKKNSKRFFTEREISEALGVGNCSCPLRRLRKNNEVRYFKGSWPPSGGRDTYYYRHKV